MTQSRQIPLHFPVKESFGREDFLSASCNLAALARIEAWPNWSHPVLVLHGPEGSGKSHLLNIWRACTKGREDCVAMDDVDRLLGTRAGEEPLFHAVNRAMGGLGYVLVTMRRPAAMLTFALPDLASRLRAAPHIGIDAPDDALLGALAVKLFADRQLSIDPEVLSYILPRLDRSFDAVRRFVSSLDEISLAEKRAITLPLARKLLQAEQGELFS